MIFSRVGEVLRVDIRRMGGMIGGMFLRGGFKRWGRGGYLRVSSPRFIHFRIPSIPNLSRSVLWWCLVLSLGSEDFCLLGFER